MKRPLTAAALVVVGAALGGLLAEVGLRVAANSLPNVGRLFHESDPLGSLVEPHGELGYRQRPGSVYHYSNGTVATSNSRGYRGPVVPIAKPRGTYRIILLGGSTTHGWGVPDDSTIDAYMRRILAERYPGHAFEVVNLAFDGYDSWQDFERLRTDGLPLDPDLVIANSGINDVRNARLPGLVDRDPRTLIWEGELRRLRKEQLRGGPTPWTLLKHYSLLARLGGILRDQKARHAVTRDANVVAYPEAADYFQRNLLRIAALTAERGIPLLLSTPPSSLRLAAHPNATSERTYWVGDAEATQRYRDDLDRRMRLVADSLRAKAAPVLYVPHTLGVELFLDDCHLTSSGNRRMAEDFVTGAAPFIVHGSGSGALSSR